MIKIPEKCIFSYLPMFLSQTRMISSTGPEPSPAHTPPPLRGSPLQRWSRRGPPANCSPTDPCQEDPVLVTVLLWRWDSQDCYWCWCLMTLAYMSPAGELWFCLWSSRQLKLRLEHFRLEKGKSSNSLSGWSWLKRWVLFSSIYF